MPTYRALLVLGALAAFSACGDSSETEAPAPESVPESDESDELMSSPDEHGCGDGTVDDGEACDDGGVNCPPGWGLCLRCSHCDGWVVAERTYVPSAAESPLPSPPYCTERVEDTESRTPTTLRVRTYDDHGRLLTEALDADPEIGTERATYTYDDDGHRIGMVRTVGERTLTTDRYHIVDGRRVASRRDANNDEVADIEQRYSYDDAGRLVSIETRDGTTQRFSYDAFGHLVSLEGGGESVEIERDDHGRMIHRTPSGRIPFAYRRDDEGRLVVELAEWGMARRDRWNHTYEDGRLSSSVYRTDPDTITRRCQITTDARGRVTERACDTTMDGEVNRTTTYDYGCVDALRESLPRTVSEASGDAPE